MTKRKKIRNIIFRVCGVGMLASFLILVLPSFYIQVWLTEAIALLFFGISWLTKSQAYRWLAADKE
jgi:predicted membrane channel-forming protein YqfA (hemolysin III family)